MNALLTINIEKVKVYILFLDSIVVSISACHVEDPGSIPGRGVPFCLFLLVFDREWTNP